MTNRSNSNLPSFFSAVREQDLSEVTYSPGALEIFDITYLHFHSVLELGLCVSGRGCCVVEGKEYPFEAGDVQVIFPFQNHLSRSEGDSFSRWYWLSINPIKLLSAWGAPELAHLENLLNNRMGLCGIIDRDKHSVLAGLIERVVLPGDERRRLACLCAMIEELAEESRGLPALCLHPDRHFLQLEPALAHVQRTLDQGGMPLVSDMAKACALSVAPFRRAFHITLGQSPRHYILACQMKKAQRMLLLTDEPITQIALALGYQDVSGFNRQFLRKYGVAPREYRASISEKSL